MFIKSGRKYINVAQITTVSFTENSASVRMVGGDYIQVTDPEELKSLKDFIDTSRYMWFQQMTVGQGSAVTANDLASETPPVEVIETPTPPVKRSKKS